ncbi:MAG: hypothetical protein ACK5HP_04375 [Bacilli bacterium]
MVSKYQKFDMCGNPKEKNVLGLIINIDQEFQFASYVYKAICESNKIQIDMSSKGTLIYDYTIVS